MADMLEEFVHKYRAYKHLPDKEELQTVLDQRDLQEDEKIKILKRMSGGKTILHIAAKRGHHEVLTIMLKAIQSREKQMELLLQTKKIRWWSCFLPFKRCNTILHEAVYAPKDKKEATVKAIMELGGLQARDKFTLLTKQNDRGLTALDILEKMGDNFKLRNMMRSPQRYLTALREREALEGENGTLRAEIQKKEEHIKLLIDQLEHQQQGYERRHAQPNATLLPQQQKGRDGPQKTQSFECSSSYKYFSPEKNLNYPSTEKSFLFEANNRVKYSSNGLPEGYQLTQMRPNLDLSSD